jgi:Uma2 family endonuclease
MSMPKYDPIYTVDEYLAIDRASDERYVYLDGVIFMMAGESPAHADISMNLSGVLYNQLLDSPCRARAKDTKVRSGPTPMPGNSVKGLFSYPDIVLICGEPEYHDSYRDVVINPTAVFEVLSPGTADFDRGEKFDRLRRWNPTLTDFVLVSQTKPKVEHYTRAADGTWSSRVYEGLAAQFTVASIRCTIKLADVYRRISFPDEPPCGEPGRP